MSITNPANQMKINAAKAALKFVKNGMTLGLGTGTTSSKFLRLLADRIKKEKLKIRGVPTSKGIEFMARSLGIPVVFPEGVEQIDLAVDGADQCTKIALLKGGGGALVREKIIDYAAKEFIVIADESKVSRVLNNKTVVEVLPFAYAFVKRTLKKFGLKPKIRMLDNGNPFISDNGNYLIDCEMEINDAEKVEKWIDGVPGVVENGVFTRFTRIIIGTGKGSYELK